MEHGLKLITFYVQKHVAALEMCHNEPLVRDKPLGAPAYVKLVYCYHAIQRLGVRDGCFIILCQLNGKDTGRAESKLQFQKFNWTKTQS